MLRLFAPLLLVALFASATHAHAQDSAFGLSRPPVAGEPPVEALPPPTEPALPFPASEETQLRLRALDLHLTTLGLRRNRTTTNGLVALAFGGVYIGLGVYMANDARYESLAPLLYVNGAASLANAAIIFGLQPNPSRVYQAYQTASRDPSISPDERLRLGEAMFATMARRSAASRYLQGSINLGMTAITLRIVFGNGGFDKHDAFDWILLASTSIGAFDAISTMVQRSEIERRWQAYQRFVADHGAATVFHEPRVRLRGLAAAPIPGGGIATAGFIF